MRNRILNNIKTGLKTEIGTGSTVYSNLQIEDFQTRLPDSVIVNYFVGMTIDRVNNASREIGKLFPVINEYSCSIVALVKNADYDAGQTELDTIVKRIIKYFANDVGNLKGLTDNNVVSGVVETVISYSMDGFDFIAGNMKTGGLGHICTISLNIKTNLNI